MKINRVYVDIDDVLNTLVASLMKHFGVENYTPKMYPVQFGWDIVGAVNHCLGEERYTKNQFWGSIPRSLWATCPRSDEFNLVLNFAEELVGRKNVHILTSPTIDPECSAGKIEWMQSNLPWWLHRQFQIGPPKDNAARHDKLLIDDSNDNVDAFKKEGGNSILVPRPHNRCHGVDTKAWLNYWFRAYLEERAVPPRRVEFNGLPLDSEGRERFKHLRLEGSLLCAESFSS